MPSPRSVQVPRQTRNLPPGIRGIATSPSLLPMMSPPFIPLKSLTAPSGTIDAIQDALAGLAERNPQLAAGVQARCEGLHPSDPRYIICMSTALTIARGIEQTQAEKAARAAAFNAQQTAAQENINEALTVRRNTFGIPIRVKPREQAADARKPPPAPMKTLEERYNNLQRYRDSVCRGRTEDPWFCEQEFANAKALHDAREGIIESTVRARALDRDPTAIARNREPLSFIDIYKPRRYGLQPGLI